MHLPSTLLLLLASRLATSVPIVSSSPPPSCIEGNCDPAILRHLTTLHIASSNPFSNINNEATETKPSSSPTTNNGRLIISISSLANEAISAEKPISTLHLTSLPGNPEKERQQSLALLKVMEGENANPDDHIHLHELPKDDLASFWTSEQASRGADKPHGCHGGRKLDQFIYLPGNIYIKSTQYISRRPDIAVVGIVLAFLCLVICVEAAGKIGDSLRKSLGCTNACRARGAIYLADDNEKVPFSPKPEACQPTFIHSADSFPPNHPQISGSPLEKV